MKNSFAFATAWSVLQPVITGLGDIGKVTVPDLTGTSPWLWIVGMLFLGGIALLTVRKQGSPRGPMLTAAVQHIQRLQLLKRGEPLEATVWSLGVIVTVMLACIGTAMTAYLLLRSQ